MMLELEKKILLSEKEYKYLLCHEFCIGDVQIHKNYYYDTDDLALNKANITYRIREKDGKYIATIKDHQGGDSSFEISKSVRNAFDDIAFNDMNINLKGVLMTERWCSEPFDGIKIMIDCNEYLDVKDYELEVEYVQGKEHIANEIIKSFGEYLYFHDMIISIDDFVNRVGTHPNKSQRFFKRLVASE